MIDRISKQRLKSLLLEAVVDKLPTGDGTYKLEAAPHSVSDPFLLVKVRNNDGGLETYLEVSVKEKY